MYTFDKEKHIHALDGVKIPGVTSILSFFFPPFKDEYAMKRGLYVHSETELWDKGELKDWIFDPVLIPYLDAWKLFRLETGFEPILIEKPMAAELRRFATVIDRLGRMDKSNVLVEIKSGKKEKYHQLQTAAQNYICKVNAIRVDKRMAVYLRDDGSYKIIIHDDKSDENEFLTLASARAIVINKGGANGNND